MQDIQNNSIILAPSVLHMAIQKELLEHTKGMVGVSLNTIEGYLLSLIPHPDQFDDVLFQYYQRLVPWKDSLTVFHDICLQDYFLQECMHLIDECILYEIPMDTLPKTTPEEKELSLILDKLYDISTKMSYIVQASKISLKNDKHIYIYPAFFDDKESILCERLRKQGAMMMKDTVYQLVTSFYHAMNMREETESLAQYIIQHDIDADDIAITFCNQRYKNLIAQVFTRYQIPFTLFTKPVNNLCAIQFQSLLAYYLEPDDEHLMALLDMEIFDSNIPIIEYKQYLEVFQKKAEDEIQELPMVESELISSYELEKLQQLCEKAKTAQCAMQQVLKPLIAMPWQDALIYISDYIAGHLPAAYHKNFIQMQSYIQHIAPCIQEKNDLRFLCSRLKKLPAAKQDTVLQGALVHHLKTLLPKRKYHFILGAIQADYPAFPLKKGIFDEAYYAKTNLPSLQMRYDHHMKQIQKQLLQSQHLIVSYPLGDYEGKGKEAALEIETFLQKKSIAYPIQYQYQAYEPAIAIRPQQAHDVYVKQDVLYGSISSLERYCKCPFSYYLRYGLQIKEPFRSAFDESKAGTLSHHILEVLTKQYGKQYVDVQLQKVETLLLDELQALLLIYPQRAPWINLLKQRLLLNIKQNLKVLKEMEEHSEMTIYQSEYEFYQDYELQDAVLRLHGFIDRIDQKNEFLRIIDYKSSPKTLQEPQVFAALQLQLITYSIIAKNTFQKKLLGSYYVSLKNENIPYIAGKMRRRPVEYIPMQDNDYADAIYNTHRMQGWNMDKQLEIMDDDGSHIVGISRNKNGEVKSRKIYDINVLEQHFHSIYQSLGNRILSGDISITPDDSACQYCHFHAICRFKGFPYKKEPLIEIDDTIYKE